LSIALRKEAYGKACVTLNERFLPEA